jgi:hypothetical protein
MLTEEPTDRAQLLAEITRCAANWHVSASFCSPSSRSPCWRWPGISQASGDMMPKRDDKNGAALPIPSGSDDGLNEDPLTSERYLHSERAARGKRKK